MCERREDQMGETTDGRRTDRGDDPRSLTRRDPKKAVGHERCGLASAALCDGLADALRERRPDLEVGRSQSWCTFSLTGTTNFAYLKHKRQARVEVWFAGDHQAFGQEHSLDIRPSEQRKGGFGPVFRARFDVASAAQVQEAADLLTQVSCPVAREKGNRGRPTYEVRVARAEGARSGGAASEGPTGTGGQA